MVNPRLDNGESQRQFLAMHNDLLGDIDKSKRAAASELAVRPLLLDPKKRILTTDNDLRLAHKLSSSIYNTDHYKEDGITEVTPDDFSFNAPPFDAKRLADATKYATRGLKLEKTPDLQHKMIDQAAQRVIIPFKQSYSTDALKSIGNRFGELYDTDKSMQAYFDNKIHDPEEYDRLNKAGKAVYGNDFEIETDPRKAAIAFGVANNNAIQEGSDSYHWQRPPQPRQPNARQQSAQDMQDWIRGTANAIRNRDVNELKRYGGVLYSGNGKSQFQDIDLGPLPKTDDLSMIHPVKQGVVIKHIDKTWVPDVDPKTHAQLSTGTYKDILNTTELDPDDPQLENKLGKVYQQHMGSTPGVEKVLLKNAVQGNKSAPTPVNNNPLNLKF